MMDNDIWNLYTEREYHCIDKICSECERSDNACLYIMGFSDMLRKLGLQSELSTMPRSPV